MTSETSKALLMIAMFASLQLALHYPRIRGLCGALTEWAAGFFWPVALRADYTFQPLVARHAHRRIHLSSAF